MASKSKTEYLDITVQNDFWNSGNGPRPPPVPNVSRLRLDSTRTDPGPVPGWKEKIKAHQSACSNIVGTAQSGYVSWSSADTTKEFLDNNGVVYQTVSYKQTGYLGQFPSMLSINPSIEAEAELLAIRNYVKSLWSSQRALQGLVAAGELAETLNMIRRPGRALFESILGQYIPSVKKRLRGKPKKSHRKIVTDTWLEYAFGWVPLTKDILDGAKALGKMNDSWTDYRHAQGKGNVQRVVNEFVGSADLGYMRRLKRSFDKHDCDIKYTGEVGLSHGYSTAPGKLKLLGVSWRDVLPAVWELIPYSFLVDYFTNVGDMLDAVAFGWSAVRWQYRSFKNEAISNYLMVGLGPVPITDPQHERYTSSNTGEARAEVSNKSITRIDWTGNKVIPTLSIHLPFYRGQFVNIAALASQRYR